MVFNRITEEESATLETSTEEQVAETIHALSMSKEPGIAAYGRGLKQLDYPFQKWMESELERGTPSWLVVHSAVLVCCQLMGNVVVLIGKRFKKAELMTIAAVQMAKAMAAHIKAANEMDQAEKSPDQGESQYASARERFFATLETMNAKAKQ